MCVECGLMLVIVGVFLDVCFNVMCEMCVCVMLLLNDENIVLRNCCVNDVMLFVVFVCEDVLMKKMLRCDGM